LLVLIPALLFLAAAGLVIASHKIPHRVAYDQLLYHQAAIETFARQWPNSDLTDYLSATTPGFHLMQAGAWRLLGWGVVGAQVLNAAITCVLLLVLGWVVSHVRERSAFVLVLPFAASIYVFASGAWVLPDNAAWLGVLVMVLVALSPRIDVRALAFGGMVLAVLTCTRQIHFWTAGLLVGAAFLRGGALEKTGTPGGSPVPLRDRFTWAAIAGIACFPAAAFLLYFYGLWGGLTPPSFQFQYHRANWAGPAFVLCVFGVLSVFYGGYVLPRLVEAMRTRPGLLVAAAGLGAAFGIIPRTTSGGDDDFLAGRRTGLWEIAATLKAHGVPFMANHTSPFIVALAILGAVALGALIASWRASPRLIIIAAFLGYGLAMAQGGELWQRYAEPFALLMMIVVIGLESRMREMPESTSPTPTPHATPAFVRFAAKAAPLGPVMLALAFAALNARDLRKPDTQLISEPAPPAETYGKIKTMRAESPWSRYMIGHQRHPTIHK